MAIDEGGAHVVTALAYDADGNKLATATKTFTLALSPEGAVTPPAAMGAFAFLTPTGPSTSPLTLTVSAPYGSMRVDYWIGNSKHLGTSVSAESNFPLFISELEPGKYPITARAMAYDGSFIGDITEAITVIEPPEKPIPVKEIPDELNLKKTTTKSFPEATITI